RIPARNTLHHFLFIAFSLSSSLLLRYSTFYLIGNFCPRQSLTAALLRRLFPKIPSFSTGIFSYRQSLPGRPRLLLPVIRSAGFCHSQGMHPTPFLPWSPHGGRAVMDL